MATQSSTVDLLERLDKDGTEHAKTVLSETLGGLRAVTPWLTSGFTINGRTSWERVGPNDLEVTTLLLDTGLLALGHAHPDNPVRIDGDPADLVYLELTRSGCDLLRSLNADLPADVMRNPESRAVFLEGGPRDHQWWPYREWLAVRDASRRDGDALTDPWGCSRCYLPTYRLTVNTDPVRFPLRKGHARVWEYVPPAQWARWGKEYRTPEENP
nr:hypothetical protein [Kibdelosporangium sp. MJ126-NF4]CEL16271.1 hypothetical protein [Kibdelosporangium sp. MJ126-NF4]CTQ94195.1 hypothetical protein [Kibdelosporangium sp. MJ126-NF4]